jgi:hypothetical protein
LLLAIKSPPPRAAGHPSNMLPTLKTLFAEERYICMKAFMYHRIRQIIALIASLLFLTACADYSYEEQILTHDDVQSEYETQHAAYFDSIKTAKTLYDAAGRGEEEFHRVFTKNFKGHYEHEYFYDRSTGKYRDEFLTAYNNYKDIPMLGHKDDTMIELISLYQQGDTKYVQTQYAVDSEMKFSITLLTSDDPREFTKPETEEWKYYDYSGKTFSARICNIAIEEIFLENGHRAGYKYEYRIFVYNMDDIKIDAFDISFNHEIQEKAFTHWLDQFYLSTFGEVVQNAKAYDVK